MRFIRIRHSTFVNADRLRETSPLFAGKYAVGFPDVAKLKLSRWCKESVATRIRRER